MRIAYIFDAVYPWVIGGVEKRIYEIARRLAKKHEVHWFGLKWWSGSNNIELDGIYVHGIGKWCKLYVNGRRSIGEGIYFGIKTLTNLIGQFDVIDCQHSPYFHCFSAKFHSLIKRSELVITWHEVWSSYWFEYLGKKGFFGCLVEKLTAKLCNRNIAVSEKTKRDLEKLGVRDVKVIPNGIDFWRINEIKKAKEESDVIFAGRLIKEKNVDILIKAVKLVKEEIPDVKCIIVGDGPEKQKLEKLAYNLRLEDNVKFVGFLENYDNLISYMKASKVFVLPSTREGFGIVALEANACGLPVITVKHEMNAVRDIITNGKNGFISNLSVKDIARKILVALNQKKNMMNNCIKNAMKYDWNKIADLTEKFYLA